MKFEIWQGEFRQTSMGYTHGTPMRKVWEGEIEARASAAGKALDSLFAQFQHVDDEHKPPDDYHGRSLSFGDVIRLGDEWYTIDVIGFQRLLGAPVENEHAYVNAVLSS